MLTTKIFLTCSPARPYATSAYFQSSHFNWEADEREPKPGASGSDRS